MKQDNDKTGDGNLNVDWDKELQELDPLETDEAMFDVTTDRIERLVGKWMQTPMYASPNTSGDDLQISEEPGEMSHETTLGQIAAVPLLNMIAKTAAQMSKEDDPLTWFGGFIHDNGDVILDLLQSVMTEGIMIANAPGLREEFDQVLGGVREMD
jgi:hypothetical protein